MKLTSVKIENYRAIEKLELPLDPSLTVFHGANGCGKTSVLSAIAVGVGDMMGALLDESTIDFCEEDWREGAEPPRVSVTRSDRDGEFTEERRGAEQTDEELEKQRQFLLDRRKELAEALRTNQKEMPIVAFYDTDRTASGMPEVSNDPKDIRKFSRLAALEGALSARTDFEALFAWFYAKEDEELRAQKARRDFDYQLGDLSAVRRAISAMLPEVSDPRFELNPIRFVVSLKPKQGLSVELSLDQLSGGYRIVLALAADLARRMAQGNPHLDDPLESEAVVLIDEIELHLHPAWQQRVLGDLRRTFPNAQFIVSTHSPQVLTTAEPQHIVELHRDGDHIVAGAPAGATYGAEAGDVLSVVMGVNERPPGNAFVTKLKKYMRLIGDGRGESEEALALRKKLERMSPYDPALNRAKLEIKQRKLFKQMAKSQ